MDVGVGDQQVGVLGAARLGDCVVSKVVIICQVQSISRVDRVWCLGLVVELELRFRVQGGYVVGEVLANAAVVVVVAIPKVGIAPRVAERRRLVEGRG